MSAQLKPAAVLLPAKTVAVAEGIKAWNPVFDVTPGELIDAIVTEKGVILNPTTDSMKAAFAA